MAGFVGDWRGKERRVWQLRSAEIVWYGEAVELSWCKSLGDLSFSIPNSSFDARQVRL